MQIFVRDLSSKTHVCDVHPEWSCDELVGFVQDRLGISSASRTPIQLIHSKRSVSGQSSVSSVLERDSTLFVSATLLGGKGGFGALLRIVGRDGKKTTNFSACRDLQGRRLRAVEGEKKLLEWEEHAEERKLEVIAAKHIKETERLARLEERQRVDVNSVIETQTAAVERVKDALDSVFSGVGPVRAVAGSSRGSVKRPAEVDASTARTGVRPKRAKFIQDFSDDDFSSSSDEEGEESEESEESGESEGEDVAVAGGSSSSIAGPSAGSSSRATDGGDEEENEEGGEENVDEKKEENAKQEIEEEEEKKEIEEGEKNQEE